MTVHRLLNLALSLGMLATASVSAHPNHPVLGLPVHPHPVGIVVRPGHPVMGIIVPRPHPVGLVVGMPRPRPPVFGLPGPVGISPRPPILGLPVLPHRTYDINCRQLFDVQFAQIERMDLELNHYSYSLEQNPKLVSGNGVAYFTDGTRQDIGFTQGNAVIANGVLNLQVPGVGQLQLNQDISGSYAGLVTFYGRADQNQLRCNVSVR